MASAFGVMGGISDSGSGSASSIRLRNFGKKKGGNRKNGFTVFCVSSSSLTDPYKTLKIRHGASESEVKKAFRHLALQYHPDVCRGSNSGVQFRQINEAYDIVMRSLRGETMEVKEGCEDDEEMDELNDWDLWEEWMGWEGAGIRDYSSHINPYI